MKFKKFSLVILFFVINFLIVYTFQSTEKYDFTIGERASEDVVASTDIENKIETDKKTKKALEEVQPLYRINPTVQAEVKSEIDSLFEKINYINSRNDLAIDKKIQYIKEQNLNLSDDNIKVALDLDKIRKESLKRYILETINQIMGSGVTKEELTAQKENVSEFFEEINKLTENEKILGIKIINNSLRPNKFLDLEKTQLETEKVRKSVSKVVIVKGENIINEGEIITKDKLELLQSIGLSDKKGNEGLLSVLGIVLILVMLEILSILYLKYVSENLIKCEKKLLLIILVITAILLTCMFLNIITGYIIPIAAASMLISILIGSEVAILSNIVISVLIYLVVGDINILIMSLISGTYASFTNIETNVRRNVFISGLKVGLMNFFIVLALSFIHSDNFKIPLINASLALFSGLLSSILVLGTLPIWEHYFDILTSLKLLELSNPNNELLKRMLIEAPGTYHHSIIVGNLAERACDKIKANSLFARVAAYYHDVGKLKRPNYYKENQITIDNPHDRLKPKASVKIIKQHITYGIELAKKYKLPKEITNIINEHHGSTLIAYFYHEAKKSNEEILENDFRYDGPRPNSREAAVVMLADSVEAAIRSIKDPTKEKIEDMIAKIVNNKLSDNQLDKSELTLKDLDTIKEAFLEVIMGMFHERIEYPDDGGVKNGTVDR